jgi:acetyltransferase-like isoleucine patch superfamily enzyme
VLLRRLYWGLRLRHLGRKVVFGRNVHIYHPRWVSIGDTCWIDDDVTLIAGPPGHASRMKRIADHGPEEGSLEIGPRCHVAVGVVIQAHGGVRVGAETGLASGSRVYSLSHHYRNSDDPGDRTRYIFGPCVEPKRQFLLVGPVVLGEGTALGLNAVVLPGAFLGDFSWVATGAVFSGDAPAGVILAGNPAVVVKTRPGFD